MSTLQHRLPAILAADAAAGGCGSCQNPRRPAATGPREATQVKTAVDSSVLFDIVKGAPGAAAAQAALEAALAQGNL